MKMYKTEGALTGNENVSVDISITPVEVVEMRPTSVRLYSREKGGTKRRNWTPKDQGDAYERYHDTWEDAMAFLLKRESDRIDKANHERRQAEDRLLVLDATPVGGDPTMNTTPGTSHGRARLVPLEGATVRVGPYEEEP